MTQLAAPTVSVGVEPLPPPSAGPVFAPAQRNGGSPAATPPPIATNPEAEKPGLCAGVLARLRAAHPPRQKG
ncbi:hypothetical protein [Methylobacterium gregans]|uniref:Uncharacterized protein n=1 Tax=Methylobacterium gregans TaxID=374424 RepID=A0AA37HKG6_9HYPH|nr:hypothetical protein [Methylobacterium gregans]MDQ0520036.1 hypothetical protein [Methylobacterium gregans]GJD77021.1 hypothetical protein NBEOAGPD_0222 [Methylobacterium gregans]